MKIRVIALGRCRDTSIRTLVDGYLKRLRRYVSLELAEAEPRGKSITKAVEKMLSRTDHVVALDAAGTSFDSRGFAAHLQGLLARHERIVFLVGDAEGFEGGLPPAAGEKLSLSPMTLQHDLARVVFLEQLYRAFTILKNEPYHK